MRTTLSKALKEVLRYREELLATILGSMLLLVIRYLSLHYWSDPQVLGDQPSQYDLRSETETILWTFLRAIIYTLASWLALRVIMPSGYTWLKHRLVDGFDDQSPEQKTKLSTTMWGIIFLGLVLLAISGCNGAHAADLRQCVVQSYRADVGVTEASGRNDGPEVERYLEHVGLRRGAPWCAAFVSYHLSACGVANPNTAWSPSFAVAASAANSAVGLGRVWNRRESVRTPLPGDVFTLFYANLGRVGHTGFVDGTDGRYIITVEGNTNGGGSRDGDGVYRRRRELKKLHAIVNYIPNEDPTSARPRHTGARKLQEPAGTVAGQLASRQHGDAHRGARHDHPRPRGHRGALALGALPGHARPKQAARPCYGDHGGAQRCAAEHLRVRHGRDRGEAARYGAAEHAHHHQGGARGEAGGGNAHLGVDTPCHQRRHDGPWYAPAVPSMTPTLA